MLQWWHCRPSCGLPLGEGSHRFCPHRNRSNCDSPGVLGSLSPVTIQKNRVVKGAQCMQEGELHLATARRRSPAEGPGPPSGGHRPSPRGVGGFPLPGRPAPDPPAERRRPLREPGVRCLHQAAILAAGIDQHNSGLRGFTDQHDSGLRGVV